MTFSPAPRNPIPQCVYFGRTEGKGKGNAAPKIGGDEDLAQAAVQQLLDAGYTRVSELAGGFGAWDECYSPQGKRRQKGAFKDKSSGELEYWTASN